MIREVDLNMKKTSMDKNVPTYQHCYHLYLLTLLSIYLEIYIYIYTIYHGTINHVCVGYFPFSSGRVISN